MVYFLRLTVFKSIDNVSKPYNRAQVCREGGRSAEVPPKAQVCHVILLKPFLNQAAADLVGH